MFDPVQAESPRTCTLGFVPAPHVAVLDSYQKELQILRARPLNVLIEGPADASDIILSALRMEAREPVCDARVGGFHLPGQDAATLVLRDVSALTRREQMRLLNWVEDEGVATQVISTTAYPLFVLVGRRLFDASLYYRLNVCLLRVGTFRPGEASPADHSARPPTITSYT